MSKDVESTLALPWAARSAWAGLNPATHVLLPLAALSLASFVLMQLHGDQAVASWVYARQGHTWALKDAWLTEQVIHSGGRTLSIGAGLVVMVAAIGSAWMPSLLGLRRPLLRLFASVALSTILVSLLKKHTGMDCPWDLTTFGGSRPFHGLFDSRPAGIRASGCFPAGHASAGYGWLALYFFALEVRPRLRYVALYASIAVGLVFGISQQARGAHFMSHDLWTAAICWFTALALFVFWPPRQRLERPCRAAPSGDA